MTVGTANRPAWRAHSWTLGVVLVFAILYYFNAYVCDDAFISFRTADNFVRGYGLRWNVEERVQSFTSPAFTLLISAVYWFAHDRGASPDPGRIYWVAILVSFTLSLAALLRLAWGREDRSWFWPVFALLMSSQAFVTFTSSGLETPLLYLLLVAFYQRFLSWDAAGARRDYFLVFLLAALGLLTRLDAALLFLPACGWLLVRGWREHRLRIAPPALLGLLPIALWALFSLVYFGFLFPNTYYSKIGLDVDGAILWAMGLAYLKTSLLQDPATLAAIAAGLAVCWIDTRALLAASASLLYVLYVASIGGDFIGFRFLAPPLLVSAMLILHFLQRRLPDADRRWARLGILATVLYGALMPASPLRAFRDQPRAHDVAFYYDASGLANWRPGAGFPFDWFLLVRDEDHCKQLRTDAFVIAVWGDGLNGFCRGPQSHLIDGHGITDPLLARLPIRIEQPFMPAHLAKPIPAGYIESILEQSNRLQDPELAPYYHKLRTIVSGPLFSRERWRYILQLNLTRERRYEKPYLALTDIPTWMRREAGRREP